MKLANVVDTPNPALFSSDADIELQKLPNEELIENEIACTIASNDQECDSAVDNCTTPTRDSSFTQKSSQQLHSPFSVATNNYQGTSLHVPTEHDASRRSAIESIEFLRSHQAHVFDEQFWRAHWLFLCVTSLFTVLYVTINAVEVNTRAH